MAYSLDLTGSRAKLKRAKTHIDAFHEVVGRDLGPHPILYPTLEHRFEPDQGAIVFRIKSLVKINDDWSLIIGDAVHNLRSALDYLAWQLAVRYFKGVEADAFKVRSHIQFPIVTKKAHWSTDKYARYMTRADRRELEHIQPFNMDGDAVALHLPHPLIMLQELSNADKHREIQFVNGCAATISFRNPVFRNCIEEGPWELVPPSTPPQPDDIILRIPVIVAGKNPQMDLDASLSCYIAVRKNWNVEDALTLIFKRIETLLAKF